MTDTFASSEHGAMPLAPIPHPRGLFRRFLYWATRHRYGKTPTAFQVVYARAPAVAVLSMVAITIADHCLRLPRPIRFLVQVGLASARGCTFCADLMLAEAIRARLGAERFRELRDFETSDRFDEREKAALAYAFALAESPRVPDAVLERARACFDERELTELVWVGALETYFNHLALPLRIGSDHLAKPIRTS